MASKAPQSFPHFLPNEKVQLPEIGIPSLREVGVIASSLNVHVQTPIKGFLLEDDNGPHVYLSLE